MTMNIQFDIANRVVVMFFATWLTIIHVSSAADWGYAGKVAEDWGYSGELGPSTWKERYPECGGKHQSPININIDSNTKIEATSHIKWKHYNKSPASMKLINNGHSLQLKATPHHGEEPYLQIGSKVYELNQTHFHWGKTNKEGSEHNFNHNRYPLEMHAVHQRVVNGIVSKPPEIVVITILFEISKQKNSGLERFLNHVSEVENAETEVEIPTFPADAIIPPFDSFYFYYEGSLTTPPCSEIATFYIRKEPANVSSNQMELFRIALNQEGEEIAGNYRPIQPTNGRTVHYVKH